MIFQVYFNFLGYIRCISLILHKILVCNICLFVFTQTVFVYLCLHKQYLFVCVYSKSICLFVFTQKVFVCLCLLKKYLFICVYSKSICLFVFTQKVFVCLCLLKKYLFGCVYSKKKFHIFLCKHLKKNVI